MPVNPTATNPAKRGLSELECSLNFDLTHPLSILPLGNSYVDPEGNRTRSEGLGSLSILDDELILEILTFFRSTASLERTSKALYAFCFHEELWRDRCIDESKLDFVYSWRTTFLTSEAQASKPQGIEGEKNAFKVPMYSDVLYYPIQCRRAFVDLFNRRIKDHIPRLTKAQAIVTAAMTDGLVKPVIMTDIVQNWPAWTEWKHMEFFLHRGGKNLVACNGALMTMSQFYQYQNSMHGRMEEVGLFVFENKFFAKSEMIKDFKHEVELFGEDLFDVLEGEHRPDNRWLLIASQGTFSQWHIDPNSTSAWNAVIEGRKLWLMLPPSCMPCGVYVSADGTAVKQPKSLLEWFASGLYEDTKNMYGKKLVEGICGPGEMIFVPRGWWHCVVNLDDTVAVTQNFVQKRHVHLVRRFLKESVQCVSGVECEYRGSLWKNFDEGLRRKYPELLKDAGVEPTVSNNMEKNSLHCSEESAPGFSFWSHLMSSNASLEYNKK